MNALIVCLAFLKFITCRDEFTIKFVKDYIVSEEKPTQLLYAGLCWEKKLEINLINEVTKCGIRCSSLLPTKYSCQDHNLLLLVDLECSLSREVLLNATSRNIFQFPFRWLMLSSRDINYTNTLLLSHPILSDSDVVLADNIGEKILLTEVYRPSINHPMQFVSRGHYNGTIFDTRPHKELFRRRRNLMRHPLTMANVIQESNNTKDHMLKEDRLDLQHDADTKLCWIAATHAFEMLNATPRYIFSYRWGYLVDGRWTGMIADIVSNKADLATNCFLFTDRLDVVTYTDVVAPIRTRFIFRQPPLTSVSNIFSLPFSTSVWVAIVACIAVSTLTLYLASKWEASIETSASQLDGSIADALLLTMSAVAQQGCFIEPRRAPGRIMEWVLFAALMALYAAYSANIVVLLQAPSNSIRSLAHLSESKMTLAALDVDYSRFLLNQHKDKIHLEITKRVIPENDKPQFYSINDGTEKIRQGMFALHSLVGPIYRRIKDTFLESEKCDLTEIDYVNGFDAFIPVKKDSPYLEMIRVVFKQIRESGLQSALVKRFQVQKPRCSNTMSAFSSVGFLDLAPVLIFMLYGTALSIFILIAEIVYYKIYGKCRNTSFGSSKKNQKKAVSKTYEIEYR